MFNCEDYAIAAQQPTEIGKALAACRDITAASNGSGVACLKPNGVFFSKDIQDACWKIFNKWIEDRDAAIRALNERDRTLQKEADEKGRELINRVSKSLK